MNETLETVLIWLRDRPWLLLVLFSAPLFLLAAVKRIFPSTPLVVLLVGPLLLSLGILAEERVFPVMAIVDAVIAGAALIDLLSLPRVKSFSAERQLQRIASLGQNHRVTLTVANHSRRRWSLQIRDDAPQDFTLSRPQFQVRLDARSRAVLHYDFKAHRRGAFTLSFVYLRVASMLRLWRRYMALPVESVVHVYPDMKQLAEYAVLARTNRLSLMGVRRTRKIGYDNEFERLRDYTPDDNYKHMEWRTTARRNKLTVKDFQTNQSQRIVFMIDCGRMMTNQAHELSLLDHSLNAMLMLSYVALRQQDQVGLICFSDQIHTFVPPRGGMKQMNQLLHASFDRFPQLVESRYDEAFLYLSSHCKKRSLVVLITNLIDEVNARQVEQYLGSLVGKHLPLGVLLRDEQLFAAADSPYARSESMLFRAAAAAEILTWRHQVLTDLEHRGVLMIDTFPQDMTAPLINRYLEIKARRLL